jgi:uncharacterized protein
MADVEVRDDPERQRYEVWVGTELAGFTVYEPGPRAYAFVHTEIEPAFEGQGLASRLIRRALDDMRARGLEVLPYCPFVARFVRRHTDYLDLVPATERAQFQLPAG